MIQIPADLAKLYTSFMEQKGVETDQHRYYIKRKQAHQAVSLFYEMGHLSGRKTRNGTSYGKSAAYGRTEPEISSSHTKKVAFNQAVFSGRKIIPQTSKPGPDTNMAPGQSGADWTEVFNGLKTAFLEVGLSLQGYVGFRTSTQLTKIRNLQKYNFNRRNPTNHSSGFPFRH